MKLVIQRVSKASVEVAGKICGEIASGLLIYLAVTHNDTIQQVKWLSNKVLNLRIFEDRDGKMNLSLLENKGSLLVVSQFTLYADCTSGRRPSFTQSALTAHAEDLYEKFITECRTLGVSVATGIFGAKMNVTSVNDGPVTFILEN